MTCQAEVHACDVGHLQEGEPKKGGKFCWCQGKSLGELAENICNKLLMSFEFDLFLVVLQSVSCSLHPIPLISFFFP